MRKLARLIPVVFLVSQALLLAGLGAVPAPESVFGFKPGADNKLATYDQQIEYLKKLAASSKYIKILEVGKTTLGRTVYFALVSDPKNLAKVDTYREIAQRLAHPLGMTDDQAHKLALEGKAIVHLDGGCHATEVAGGQMMPQLAYDLLSRTNDPHVKLILDNDIVLLWPTMNADGMQMVAEWTMKNVGTPYEQSGLPRLYQEYVGHDNNRDAYMMNMIESRMMEHFWRQWEPNIIYVYHQTAPFPTRIWLPPFTEPVGAFAPPMISREVNMIGMAIAKGLDERGQTGAVQYGRPGTMDSWYPGYVDYAPVFKNIPAFWTETAGQIASPREYTANDLPQNFRALRQESMYSSPWQPGWWRLADAVAYDETAALATLEWAAKYKESLLYNRYQSGRDQIAKGKKEAPYAYFVAQDQRDPVAAVEMLRRLAFAGVRVYQLTAPVTAEDMTWPAGTWVIPTDQEFAALARELLDVQNYPDIRQYPGGPPERPYDVAGWTLPLQMGVKVMTATKPLADEVRSKMKLLGTMPDPKVKFKPYNLAASEDPAPFDSVPGIGFNSNAAAAAIVPPAGKVTGSGAALAVDPAQNNAFRAINRAWKQGGSVQYLAGSPGTGARFVISGLTEAAQTELVNSLALSAERTAPNGTPVKKPRIGLYQQWGGSMDAGWTQWLLEQYGFDFVILRPEDFHSSLRDKVDVILFADDARLPGVAEPGRGGRGGGPGGRGAGAGREVRPEYAYSLTADDLKGLETFVRAGGTLVCFNGSCRFAIRQFKLPVRNVLEGLKPEEAVKPEEYFLRGSIVEVATDPTHAVMAGMLEKAPVFSDSSPVFETLGGFKGKVLAKYQETGSPLLSGYLIGEKFLQGKAAALDVELENGHIVLIGFRPQWRCQSFGTFRVVFNSALYAQPGAPLVP